MKVKSLRAFAALILALSMLCGITAFAAESENKPFEDSMFFEYGDYSIHYRTVPAEGEQRGRILMIHGFMCSTYSWRNLAADMSRRGYECVLVDLPDFGFSTRETASTNVVPREEIITALMESIAPTDEWIIAGHSMGGGVAINIAAVNPVKALLLYCPCPQPTFPAFLERIVKTKLVENMTDTFLRLGVRIDPLVRAVIFAATADYEFAKEYDLSGVTDPVFYDGFGKGICEMMYNVQPTDLEKAKNITAPVLLCQAEKDVILTSAQKTEINETFDFAEQHVLAGAGHQCIENRSAELSEITDGFLTANGVAGA